jgi:hypothetical protein
LYTFARRLAHPFSDSRRRRFLTDRIPGLVIANHVHLTKGARASGAPNLHAALKRLSGHLGSEHGDRSPLADAAPLVTDDSLIVADTTDLAKYYAKGLEGLGRVHDGSDPDTVVVKDSREADAYRVARERLRRVASTLVEPERFEAVFARVMCLVSLQELGEVISNEIRTPLGHGD